MNHRVVQRRLKSPKLHSITFLSKILDVFISRCSIYLINKKEKLHWDCGVGEIIQNVKCFFFVHRTPAKLHWVHRFFFTADVNLFMFITFPSTEKQKLHFNESTNPSRNKYLVTPAIQNMMRHFYATLHIIHLLCFPFSSPISLDALNFNLKIIVVFLVLSLVQIKL